MKTTQRYVKSFDGMELYLKCDYPEKPKGVVVIVHGGFEHQGRYQWVSEQLVGFGYTTYRYDNRGHGRSSGTRGYVSNYEPYLDDCNFIVELAKSENKGLPVFTLGHSMGGFITGGYGAKYPGKVQGQIYSGPAFKPAAITLQFVKMDIDARGFEECLNEISEMICSVKSIVDDYTSDPWNLHAYSLAYFIGLSQGLVWLDENMEKNTNPFIIFHGEKDILVPTETSEEFMRRSPANDKDLVIYKEMLHEILNEDAVKEEIMEQMRKWMDARI